MNGEPKIQRNRITTSGMPGRHSWLLSLLLAALTLVAATPSGFLTYDISTTGWAFTATASADHTFVRLSADSLDPGAPLNNYYWDLELESANGIPLAPGLYSGATRWPFNAPTEPGMWLSGNHRGDNIITGFFRVNDVEFGSGTTVTRFSVDFRQYDEGNPNNWVDGQWRFNAVPEPGLWALLATGALMLFWSRRRAAALR
jgi:hypothetical protein